MRVFPKKTRFFFLALLILVTAYFLYRPHESKKPFEKIGEAATTSLSMVITSDSSTSVKLSYDGTQWLVNDTYQADDIRISNLLFLLNSLEFLNPVPQSMQDAVSQKLHGKGFLIEVHKKNKRWLEAYLMEDKSAGLLGATKKSEVFVAGTGSHDLDIASIVSTETAFWCVNQIFSFSIDKLNSVCIQHLSMPTQSFCIDFNSEKKPLLKAMGDSLPLAYDEAVMKRYLTYFGNVFADHTIAGGEPEQKALENDLQHIIEVQTNSGKYTVACIGLKMPDGNYNTDKFLLYHYEKKQWALASWVNFDLLLKNRDDFQVKI